MGSSRARAGRVVRALLLAALAPALAACGRKPPDRTPEGAVKEFVARMSAHRGAPGEAKAAFELLSEGARKNLEERAERGAAAIGKPIAPESLLAPASFRLRFAPTRFSSRHAGRRALVEVRGASSAEVAHVPCVLEEGRWRLDLALPPLPPVVRHPTE